MTLAVTIIILLALSGLNNSAKIYDGVKGHLSCFQCYSRKRHNQSCHMNPKYVMQCPIDWNYCLKRVILNKYDYIFTERRCASHLYPPNWTLGCAFFTHRSGKEETVCTCDKDQCNRGVSFHPAFRQAALLIAFIGFYLFWNIILFKIAVLDT